MQDCCWKGKTCHRDLERWTNKILSCDIPHSVQLVVMLMGQKCVLTPDADMLDFGIDCDGREVEAEIEDARRLAEICLRYMSHSAWKGTCLQDMLRFDAI
jgi:hypothetical protein